MFLRHDTGKSANMWGAGGWSWKGSAEDQQQGTSEGSVWAGMGELVTGGREEVGKGKQKKSCDKKGQGRLTQLDMATEPSRMVSISRRPAVMVKESHFGKFDAACRFVSHSRRVLVEAGGGRGSSAAARLAGTPVTEIWVL